MHPLGLQGGECCCHSLCENPQHQRNSERENVKLLGPSIECRAQELSVLRCDWNTKVCSFQVNCSEPVDLSHALQHVQNVQHVEGKNLKVGIELPEVQDRVKSAIFFWNDKIGGIKPLL